MKCIVTGSQGLLGSELCRQLHQIGQEVIAVDNGFRGTANPDCTKFIKIDIGKDSLDSLPTDVDYVFHMAAINGTQYFYDIPNQLLVNNFMCDIRMFEWSKKCSNLKGLIYASSSEVPAGDPHDAIPETQDITIKNIHNPRWSYRLAKVCSENYLANSSLPWVIVRYFNVYGVQSKSGHFVYDIVEKLKNNNFDLIGATETRAYCHVEDAMDATIRVAPHVGQIVNIGSDQEISSIDAATIIAKELGFDNVTWNQLPGRTGSSQRRCPNLSVLRKLYPEYNPRSLAQGFKDVHCKRSSQ